MSHLPSVDLIQKGRPKWFCQDARSDWFMEDVSARPELLLHLRPGKRSGAVLPVMRGEVYSIGVFVRSKGYSGN